MGIRTNAIRILIRMAGETQKEDEEFVFEDDAGEYGSIPMPALSLDCHGYRFMNK